MDEKPIINEELYNFHISHFENLTKDTLGYAISISYLFPKTYATEIPGSNIIELKSHFPSAVKAYQKSTNRPNVQAHMSKVEPQSIIANIINQFDEHIKKGDKVHFDYAPRIFLDNNEITSTSQIIAYSKMPNTKYTQADYIAQGQLIALSNMLRDPNNLLTDMTPFLEQNNFDTIDPRIYHNK